MIFMRCGCNEIGSLSGNLFRIAFNSGMLRYAAEHLPTIVCRGRDLSLVVDRVCIQKKQRKTKKNKEKTTTLYGVDMLIYTYILLHILRTPYIHAHIGTPYIDMHMHSKSDMVCTPSSLRSQ